MSDFICKPITSMEKIMGKNAPTAEGMDIPSMALKGETLSWQIAYYWGGMMKRRARIVTDSPICSQIRVRMVYSVPCEYPAHMEYDENYLTTEPGLYPDLLRELPESGIPLVSGHWKSLWIDVETDGVDAGTYPVTIRFFQNREGKEQELGSATVMIEVLPVQLPPMPIPHTEWLHTDCISNYYQVPVFSEKYWEYVEKFVRNAVKRSCNMLLTPVFTPPIDTAVGGERKTVQLVDVTVTEDGYIFGYDRFRRWVDMCRRCGILYYEISHLFTQWGATHAPKIMGVRDGVYCQLFGWETDAHGKEYARFLHEFLVSFRQELHALGIEKQVYFHISDEPHENDLQDYRVSRSIVEKDLEGYAVIDALSDYTFFEEGLVKQPIPSLDHIGPFLENRPEKLWTYYCTAQCLNVSNRFIVMPGCRTRILGTILYKYALDGFLHWGFNFYNSEYSLYAIDPYRTTDAEGTFPSGDPFLVYPGKDGDPEESIRMMLMDEAMSDLRAMNCLEKLAGRETVMQCIEPEGEIQVNYDSYPCSITYMMSMRQRINEAIKRYLTK